MGREGGGSGLDGKQRGVSAPAPPPPLVSVSDNWSVKIGSLRVSTKGKHRDLVQNLERKINLENETFFFSQNNPHKKKRRKAGLRGNQGPVEKSHNPGIFLN